MCIPSGHQIACLFVSICFRDFYVGEMIEKSEFSPVFRELSPETGSGLSESVLPLMKLPSEKTVHQPLRKMPCPKALLIVRR
jgi:hypothetical protein